MRYLKTDCKNLCCLFTYLMVLLLPLNISAQTVKLTILEQNFIFGKVDFKACHASTIVKLANNDILAAWFGGSFEGSPDVGIWIARKTADGWTKPVNVAVGAKDGTAYACWNPVLFQAKNGKLYLHYKVGPNPRSWWAMYKMSNDNGKTWSEAISLPDGFLGPIKNKPVQLANGKILYPSSTESLDEKTWAIHIESSDQNLKHWRQTPIDCDTFQVIQPSILCYPGHRLQLLARSKQNAIVQAWSEDDGNTWSKVTKTSLPNPNSGSDATTLPNYLQLLVYNPLNHGKNWWDGRSVLKLAASTNGLTWEDIYTFEQEQSGEYSYPAIISDKNGNVYITYTANRINIKYVKLHIN